MVQNGLSLLSHVSLIESYFIQSVVGWTVICIKDFISTRFSVKVDITNKTTKGCWCDRSSGGISEKLSAFNLN